MGSVAIVFHGPHALEVHDRRAVDAGEAAGIEPLLEDVHPFAQQPRASTDMQAHVVGVGLDPVDLLDLEDQVA